MSRPFKPSQANVILNGKNPCYSPSHILPSDKSTANPDGYKLTRFQAYNKSASFVPLLTSKVLQYLSPRPHDQILDIGCGDAVLSLKISQACAHLTGLDASPNFIEAAKDRAAASSPQESSTTFILADCRRVSRDDCPTQTDSVRQALAPGRYDKVFSNAAMHWILRDETTRPAFFSDVFELLKPGGKFVFEMGGWGNVREVRAAITAVIAFGGYGVSVEDVRRADPWFFASEGWMRDVLQQAGFEVEVCETEERPTRCTESEGGGLAGWVELMCAQFLQMVEAGIRREVVEKVVLALEGGSRREDGSVWLGYVRLRAVARKPE